MTKEQCLSQRGEIAQQLKAIELEQVEEREAYKARTAKRAQEQAADRRDHEARRQERALKTAALQKSAAECKARWVELSNQEHSARLDALQLLEGLLGELSAALENTEEGRQMLAAMNSTRAHQTGANV
jgi:hypothetical protein